MSLKASQWEGFLAEDCHRDLRGDPDPSIVKAQQNRPTIAKHFLSIPGIPIKSRSEGSHMRWPLTPRSHMFLLTLENISWHEQMRSSF